MSSKVNEAVVGDAAKLMIYRLIARRIRCDRTLIEKAKVVNARQTDKSEGWPFVREWNALLLVPLLELTPKLISRDREVVWLRNSSPFYLADRFLKNPKFRVRIARAARRRVSGACHGARATFRTRADQALRQNSVYCCRTAPATAVLV
jgi:hypothetical protein